MDIIVLAKYVPNVERIPDNAWDLEKGTLLRSRLQMTFNTYDKIALNMALALKAQGRAAKIVVLSMGPPNASDMLKEALAYGADEGILLTDKAFAGADTIATAYALAQGILHLKSTGRISAEFGVLSGMQSPDGDTAQVPAQVAEMINAPLYPYISDLTVTDTGITFTALNTVGTMQITTQTFPFVATATKLYPTLPFYVSLDKMLLANSTAITTWSAADLKLDDSRIGLTGSRTRVSKVFSPPRTARDTEIVDVRDPDFQANMDKILSGLAREFGQADSTDTVETQSENAVITDTWYNGPVVALCEIMDGHLAQASLEIASTVTSLAKQLNTTPKALVVADENPAIVKTLQHYGITEVLFVTDCRTDLVCVHHRARAISALLKTLQPQIVIASATLTGRVLAPYISSELNCGLTADCSELTIREFIYKNTAYPGILHQTRPALGGNIMATIVSVYDKTEKWPGPQMATARPGVFSAIECPADVCTSRTFSAKSFEQQFMETYVVNPLDSDDEALDLTQFDVVVCIGRAVANREQVDTLVRPFCQYLEQRLNTPVGLGCTRAVVDDGILSHAHQIGQTGIVIKPKLYIAIGVSGAIQHKIGMEHADTVISINVNKDAAIHTVSDVVILGDWISALSQLNKTD